MLQRIALAICATAITATVSSAWAQDDGEVPYYIKTGDPTNPFTKDGQPFAAKRVKVFQVDRNTLQLTAADHVLEMGGMGMSGSGMGMGMSAGGKGGMGMGGAGGGLGSTGPGGMAGGAEGGMGYGGMMGGMAAPSAVEKVYAFVFDDEQVKGRTKIEVLTGVQSNHGMGMGAGQYMGSMGGEGSGEMGSGMGMEGMMGDGMGSRPSYVLGHLTPLEGIAEFNAKRKQSNKAPSPWTKETAALVANFIRLHVWKQDAIRDLKSSDRSAEQMVATEKLLRELLSEDYDSQLARQQLELTRLQQRLKNVENEIGRRRQAKERVVEVQLGKLVLESQGILDEGL